MGTIEYIGSSPSFAVATDGMFLASPFGALSCHILKMGILLSIPTAS